MIVKHERWGFMFVFPNKPDEQFFTLEELETAMSLDISESVVNPNYALEQSKREIEDAHKRGKS